MIRFEKIGCVIGVEKKPFQSTVRVPNPQPQHPPPLPVLQPIIPRPPPSLLNQPALKKPLKIREAILQHGAALQIRKLATCLTFWQRYCSAARLVTLSV